MAETISERVKSAWEKARLTQKQCLNQIQGKTTEELLDDLANLEDGL
jgi:hypothetical protein